MSRAKLIADALSSMDGLDRADRYVEAIRVGKIIEEAGEAMQALIAYHHVNPRKPAGPLEDVIKELCDVALSAKVAIESFGFDAEDQVARREVAVLDRLRDARCARALTDVVRRASELPPLRPDEADEEAIDGLTFYRRVIDAVGDSRDLAWGTMVYACAGERGRDARPVPPDWDRIVANAPDGYWEERGGVPEIVDGAFPAQPAKDPCGWEHRVWLGLGVEGPQALRDREVYIPAPFGCGKCPDCGSPLLHARWDEDEAWDEPRPVPSHGARFVVPTLDKAREFAARGYTGAEFIEGGRDG